MSGDNVTKVLGDCLLQGWVMTDETCSNEGCYVPLMRSGRNIAPSVTFCARCDGVPNNRIDTSSSSAAQARQSSPNHSQSSRSEHTHTSRSSTPITEPSSELSLAEGVQPVPAEEARRRREQSDQASAEIGDRLLKGWAMLADECPNNTCFGIPLVRPPSNGREKDPRKECVVCGTIYMNENDMRAQEAPRDEATVGHPHTTISRVDSSRQPAANLKPSSSIQTKLGHPGPALLTCSNSLEDALRALSSRISSLSADAHMVNVEELRTAVEAMDKVLQTIESVHRLSNTCSD